MAHLNISLVLLLVFCSSVAGKTFWTYQGTRCIEDCKVYWGEYRCKTVNKDGKSEIMYCSPKENTDYLGRRCEGCNKHGYDYYWCEIDLFRWGFCGLVSIDNKHYGSQTGALCSSECGKSSKGYYRCVVDDGLDYCSPSENTDYKNRQCKKDSPCGKHNNDYKWCAVEGGWGYCGLTEPRMFTHWTYKNDVCIDECQYYESKNYYWCHTYKNDKGNEYDWDYCSPEVNVTYKGKPCHSDHSCGLHGHSYNWCWTSDTEYDYCGPIEDAECSYVTDTHLSRRTPESNRQEVVTCTRVDKGNKITTDFTAEPAPDDITDGSQWRHEVENIIRQWHNGYLVDEARPDLIRSPAVHVDSLSPINHKNQRYYNLQVLLNQPQTPGQSTILSQVLVPQGVPARYIRRAFLESLRMRARITIEVSTLNHG